MKQGGEVSKTLEQLYQFVLNQLLQANITLDPIYLESVIKVLSPLRDAWSRLAKTAPEPSATLEPAPPATPFATRC